MNHPAKLSKFLRILVFGKSTNSNNGEIAKTLANGLGFSYEMVPSTEGIGILLQNGSWTGMLGRLQRNETDICVSVMLTEERAKAFHFSYPFSAGDMTFARRKFEYSPDVGVFLHPFSTQVWLVILICLCVMVFSFYAVLRKKYTPLFLIVSTISSFLNQGMNIHPKKPAQYLLLAPWFLGIGFLLQMYSAVLLSFLTFPSENGVRTIKDLAAEIAKGKYRVASAPGGYMTPVLIRSADPSMQIIGHSLQEDKGAVDFLPILEDLTVDKKVAFIDKRNRLLPYKDFYFISEENFFPFYSGVVMRKDFCCKTELKEMVIRLMSSGIFEKLISDDRYRTFLKDVPKIERSRSENTSEGRLTVKMFKGPLIFLTLSHTFALLVLLIELYYEKCIRKLL